MPYGQIAIERRLNLLTYILGTADRNIVFVKMHNAHHVHSEQRNGFRNILCCPKRQKALDNYLRLQPSAARAAAAHHRSVARRSTFPACVKSRMPTKKQVDDHPEHRPFSGARTEHTQITKRYRKQNVRISIAETQSRSAVEQPAWHRVPPLAGNHHAFRDNFLPPLEVLTHDVNIVERTVRDP
jgi:hypothetical protein